LHSKQKKRILVSASKIKIEYRQLNIEQASNDWAIKTKVPDSRDA
jgi:hypothetical protein